MRVQNVALNNGPEVAGVRIAEVTVREPSAGELRGLSIGAIATMDVAAMIRLLPRITEPALSAAQIEALGAYDFGELAGRAAGFFMTAPQEEEAATPPLSPTE